MALNLDAVGKPFAPLTKDYTWKDVVLYALGVGAGFSDLDYCYEKDLKVIPSFSIASIFDILMQIGLEANVNLAGVLHGEQELIFHNPIPVEGTMTTQGKITHIYDKGEGRGAQLAGGRGYAVHGSLLGGDRLVPPPTGAGITELNARRPPIRDAAAKKARGSV